MKNFLIPVFLFLQCLNCYCQEWITYTSPDNSFKIKSQGTPEVMKLDAMYGIDSTLIYTFKGTKNLTFNLTVQYFSDEKLKPEFNDEKRFELLKMYSEITIGMIGKVIHSEKISLSEHLGIYIEGEETQGRNQPYPPIYIKAYLVDNRIYQILLLCSPETKGEKQKDVIFDSFEILE